MKVRSKKSVDESPQGGARNPHLSPDSLYEVIGLDDECFRIVNDVSEPVLYPKTLFDVIDATVPASWMREDFKDGEYRVNPRELAAPGFYEDYFDGKAEAVSRFHLYLAAHGIKRTRG